MTQPRRVDANPLTALARDVSEALDGVRRIRTDQALSAIPSSLARVVTEQRGDGTMRIGVVNNATGATAWLTGWF